MAGEAANASINSDLISQQIESNGDVVQICCSETAGHINDRYFGHRASFPMASASPFVAKLAKCQSWSKNISI